MKITVINGSPNPTSRISGIIEYTENRLRENGFEIERINVAELPPEDLIYTRFNSESIVNANKLVSESDALIIASPVYQGAYTGVLKTFLDLIPERGLEDKTVLPLFIGGSKASLLSMDYSLKPVLSSLGSRNIMGGVFTVGSQVTRNNNGDVSIDRELLQFLELEIQKFVMEVQLRQK